MPSNRIPGRYIDTSTQAFTTDTPILSGHLTTTDNAVTALIVPQTYTVPAHVNIPAAVFDEMVAAINRQYERSVAAGTSTASGNSTMTAETLRQALDIVNNMHRRAGEPVQLVFEAAPETRWTEENAQISMQQLVNATVEPEIYRATGRYTTGIAAPQQVAGWAAGAPAVRRPRTRNVPVYNLTDQEPEDL